MRVDPTAVVAAGAKLGRDVQIGPFCIIESDVVLGDGCRLEGRVTIKSGTTLGPENHVFEGAVLGGYPQHLKMHAQIGTLEIGARNTIRENVTMHRAMAAGQATIVGNDNLVMVNSHVAHDCRVGNNVVLINNTMLGGHVEIHDRVYMAGGAGIQQFCRIGRLATIGGQGRVTKDLPPYVVMDGLTGGVVGLNLVGIRRAGYTSDDIAQLKAAYRVIFRSGLTWNEVLTRLPGEFPDGPAAEFHQFFSTGKRGFVCERRTPAAASVRLEPPAEEAQALRIKAG
ncbi:MAG: acyl-ACP--UDP-N-acetylglucosamine O-acyltransferase [Planctomycetes bacterium]|nr:acyl-ACP--UDP-N-acetylglucosamine O-acyltransferase [Planctomycetota bacterium]